MYVLCDILNWDCCDWYEWKWMGENMYMVWVRLNSMGLL